jgi:hypothetical protein
MLNYYCLPHWTGAAAVSEPNIPAPALSMRRILVRSCAFSVDEYLNWEWLSGGTNIFADRVPQALLFPPALGPALARLIMEIMPAMGITTYI